MKATTNLETLPAYLADELHRGAKRHWEVMAVPGSGKTTFLINLLVTLLKRGVEPSAIRVLSFGTETVKEFNRRTAKLIASGNIDREVVVALRSVRARTIHSMARTMVPPQYARLTVGDCLLTHVRDAIDAVFSQATDYEPSMKGRRALYRHLDALRLGAGPELLLKIFDHARATGEGVVATAASLAPGALDGLAQVLPQMLKAYEASLARAGVSDFAKLLRDAVKKGKVPQLEYVLLDEYQDCTASQRMVLKVLARRADHVVAVGDVYQSLYGFAGAYPARLNTFLPDVGRTRLNVTKRFTHEIAALANGIAGTRDRSRIVAVRHGDRPLMVESAAYSEGLMAVLHRVQELLGEGVDPSQIAIVGRTKMLLKDCEDHLLRHAGIHCHRNGLNLDVGAVETVLCFVDRVRAAARDGASISLQDVHDSWRYKHAPDSEYLVKALPKLRRAVSLAAKARDGALDRVYRPCADAFVSVLRAMKIDAQIFKDVRNEVAKWAPSAVNYTSPQAMFRAIRGAPQDAIVTTTMHRAKGMEWDHVLVVGVTEGLMPIYKLQDGDVQALQQERNALYVAVTRARHTVTLFHAPRPHARSQRVFDQPSQFVIDEAVQEALDWQ